jgi:hypothetical protein
VQEAKSTGSKATARIRRAEQKVEKNLVITERRIEIESFRKSEGNWSGQAAAPDHPRERSSLDDHNRNFVVFMEAGRLAVNLIL